MKKIIVTGATSMIGTALIENAIKEGTEVYALVRPNTSRKNRIISSPLVHIIAGTLEEIHKIEGLPLDCDVFYHFAWTGTEKTQRDDPAIQEKNICYTLEAVKLAKKCGCKKFVGAGSQAEYGPTAGIIDSDTRLAPVISYGMAKLAAGNLSRKMCERLEITHIWGRIFSVYGPHDNDGTMLDYAIGQFSTREEAIFSSATQMWNYLYESDAGRMFYLIGEKVEENSIFRIANNHSQPIKLYIEEVAQIMETEDLCIFNKSDNQNVVYGIETCDDKLFEVIDYQPKVSFKEGIKIMIQNRSEK